MGKAIRDAVHEIDPRQSVASRSRRSTRLRGAKLSEPRVTTALLVSFAVLALIITAAGLAGVIAFGVNQRTNEIGIRIALGAESTSVIWLVMKQGVALAVVGVVVGLGVSLSLTKLMSGLLFATPPTDALDVRRGVRAAHRHRRHRLFSSGTPRPCRRPDRGASPLTAHFTVTLDYPNRVAQFLRTVLGKGPAVPDTSQHL